MKLRRSCKNCMHRYQCSQPNELRGTICKRSAHSQFEPDPDIKRQMERQLKYDEMLHSRDAAIQPIQKVLHTSEKTGREYTYLLCPCCRGVLNKYDTFCRFCGQRIKEDDKGGSCIV